MTFTLIEFATIRMCVSDVANSRDWYRRFFGADPVEDLENFVSFKIANTLFDLAVVDAKSPLSKGGSVGYWFVDDLRAAIEHALSLGAKVYRGPLDVKEVGRTIVRIEDPHGNVFGLEGALA